MSMTSQISLKDYLGNIQGAVSAATYLIIILAIFILIQVVGIRPYQMILAAWGWIKKLLGARVGASEKNYHRDVATGKLKDKSKRVKLYRFLNDLTIDLGLKRKGVVPYELLLMASLGTLLSTMLLTQLLFGSMVMTFLLFPIILLGVMCVLYTKANIAHDRRIEAILESENIICNSITAGVVTAVRQSIDVMPPEVKDEYRVFLDDIEIRNMHIRQALNELGLRLGSVSDDFIKKCIVFELEEEHGSAGVFKDVVELNGIRSSLRIEMRRRFEEVKTAFLIGAGMIVAFMVGLMGIFIEVRGFYLTTVIGQLILSVDILILILEFVYLTYLRAKDI